jgi:hypothetical protein
MPVTVEDIRGVLGILPTPSTPDADHWSCENSVDLDETARMVETILDAGVSIFLTNGSFGEGRRSPGRSIGTSPIASCGPCGAAGFSSPA